MNILQLHTIPNSQECILFFNGWGMDLNAVSHLQTEYFDVFECSNYSNIAVNFECLLHYKKVHIVAWSMGVWACMQVGNTIPIPIAQSIAINGTGAPMHNTMGIPNAIFKGTLDAWNDDARTKFTMRMFGSRTEWQQSQQYVSKRTSNDQKNELFQIFNSLQNNDTVTDFMWSVAVIGERDYIFTAENQQNYWQSQVKWFILPIPHYPFAGYTSWDEILNLAE